MTLEGKKVIVYKFRTKLLLTWTKPAFCHLNIIKKKGNICVYCLRTRMLRIHVKVKISPSQLPRLLFYDLGSPAHGVLLRLVWRQHHLQPVHLRLRSASHRLEHKHPRSAAGEMTSSYCHLTGKCHQKSVWSIKHWNLWVGLKGGLRKVLSRTFVSMKSCFML